MYHLRCMAKMRLSFAGSKNIKITVSLVNLWGLLDEKINITVDNEYCQNLLNTLKAEMQQVFELKKQSNGVTIASDKNHVLIFQPKILDKGLNVCYVFLNNGGHETVSAAIMHAGDIDMMCNSILADLSGAV